MVKKIILLLFIGSLSFSLQAQRYKFPDAPAEFITFVDEALNKTGKSLSQETAVSFKALWEGGKLSATQKEKIIQISQKMALGRSTIATDYTNFFRALFNGVQESQISAAQLDSYLDTAEKLAESKKANDVKAFFSYTSEFLLSKALQSTKYSRLYAMGSYTFEYVQDPSAIQNEFSPSLADQGANPNLPNISGAIIRFNQVDLIIATPFDSTGLQKTQGVFVVNNHHFIGKGGEFNWSSVGLDPSAVYCEFDSFVFDTSKPVLKAKNVKMHYTLMLNQVITGDFEFVSKARKDASYAVYPKFISHQNDVTIPQLGKNLTYTGGFSLQGIKIYSYSTDSRSVSTISGLSPIDGSRAFNVYSRGFLVTDSLVTANHSRFAIYLGESDSLYHADLQFKLYRKDRIIQMIRDRNSANANTPFINNFHEFYIGADVVRYNLERDSLDIFMLGWANKESPATFESFDFFDQQRYNEMIGVQDFHPTKFFSAYGRQRDTVSFKIQDMAADFRRNEGILRSVASNLQSQGFLEFDAETGDVLLGRRIMQTDSADLYIRSAARVNQNSGVAADSIIYNTLDHDNFYITSVVSGMPNASLSRENNELLIRGIENFPMSRALGVYIIPDSSSQSIKVYGGRNIYMEKGEVRVGNFRFIGKNFFLLYDQFALEMPEIDKILFAILDTTESRQGTWHEYGGEISFGAGNMQINDNLNKAGLKKGKIRGGDEYYESFPKLSIPLGGEVFFATDYRKNFTYDSTRAVFQLDEIDMDSLNTKIPIFPGRFISNIFPEFEEELIPMNYPDTTMGFIHKPPSSGYSLYPSSEQIKGAKIEFNRDLVMNQDGLFSGGKISYLSTVLDAPEYFFMPDSLISDNINFEVQAKQIGEAEFASARGSTAQLNWLTGEDKMVISNQVEIIRLEDARRTLAEGAFEQRYRDKLFTLYEKIDPLTISGNLYISRNGLEGEGNLTRRDFSILSVSEEPFRFGIDDFSGSNVEFRINSTNRDPYEYDKGHFYNDNKAVLVGNFVDFDFDLTAGKANIKPDQEFGDFTALTLPYAEYRTSIKSALWDLKKQSISMEGDSSSYFTSTIFGSEDYNEENLRFNALSAFYDIPNLSMKVDGVPYINSADASIVPENGTVVILKDAEMQELENSRVLIDTLNRYHRLFDGHIRIKSRFEFEGDATYQFVNVQSDTFNVKFDKFELIEPEDTKKSDRRKGNVPKFTFAQGTVTEEDEFYITSRVLYKGRIEMYANRKDLSLDGFIKLDLSTSNDFNEWIPYKSDKGDEVFLELDETNSVDEQTITSGLHFTGFSSDIYTTFLSPKEADTDLDVFLASGVLDYNPSINEFKISPQTRRDGSSYTGNRLIFDDDKSSIFLEGKFNIVDEKLSSVIQSTGSARINVNDKTYSFDQLMTFDLPLDFKVVSLIQPQVTAIIPEKTITLQKNDPMIVKIAELTGDKEFRKVEESLGVRPIPITQIFKELKKTFVFSKVDMQWSDEYKTFYSQGPLKLLSIFDKIYDEEVTGFIEIRKNSDGDEFELLIQVDPDVWYYFEYEAGLYYAVSSDEAINDLISGKDFELAGIDKKESFVEKFRSLYGATELPKKKEEEKKVEESEKKKEDDDDDGF